MSVIRWFFATRKGDDPAVIADLCESFRVMHQASLDEAEPGEHTVVVVDGGTDWRETEETHGGKFESWIPDVPSRRDRVTRRYVYDGVIVPVGLRRGAAVGRATAQIVTGFISRSDRPGDAGYVLVWNVEDEQCSTTGVYLDAGEAKRITGFSKVTGGGWQKYATPIVDGYRVDEEAARRTRRVRAGDRPEADTGAGSDAGGTSSGPASRRDPAAVDAFRILAADIIEKAEGVADRNERASQYTDGAIDFLNDVVATAEKIGFVTEKMAAALDRIDGNLDKWDRPSQRDEVATGRSATWRRKVIP